MSRYSSRREWEGLLEENIKIGEIFGITDRALRASPYNQARGGNGLFEFREKIWRDFRRIGAFAANHKQHKESRPKP